MKPIRLKPEKQTSYYHLMSRTVNGEAWFGSREREILRKMIWQVAEFSGIRVITYAVMKNHFHLLVEAPPKSTEISDKELVRRFRVLYPEPTPWQPMRAEVLEWHLQNQTPEGEALRLSLTQRMHDISLLMKTLKQRFTRWFNQSRDRFGPLWSERFKSVLVEGNHWALRTVAAYIDLNAVRSGLVEDPKDYRFCGYAEALGGSKLARRGLAIVDPDLAGYRQTLYGAGAGPKDGKISFNREEALRVLNETRGELPLATILRCRIRYFSDGVVLGSKEFVEAQIRARGKERKHPAVPKAMRGAQWRGLSVAQGLHKNLFQ